MLSIYDALAVIATIVACGMMGAVCGLLSYFLDYTFWPGSIFKFYLPWLAKRVLKGTPDYKFLAVMGDEQLMQEAGNKFWYKVLGGCSVCLNIWLAMISWMVICFLTPFAWYYGFAYIMVSSAVIRRLVGAVYQ